MDDDQIDDSIFFYCHIAKIDFIYLKEYNLLVDSLWNAKENEINDLISEQIKIKGKNNTHKIVEGYSQDIHDLQTRFPETQRDSLVIMTFNKLESNLEGISQIILSALKSKLKTKDIHGKGIARSKLIFDKIANFRFENYKNEWDYVVGFQAIRNLLVHSDGFISPDNIKTVDFIKKNAKLSISGGRVNIQEGCINELIQACIDLIELLGKEVDYFIKKNKLS
ncbi:hypothetical protein [Serratia plymuthica]|uniref:hypothetical protein n=1 Tax=Serratia plymuthica TaxID=82996 RepID=UPI001E2B525E|nr:hypothetical protein [Serratia plymuthica]CAI1514982.1 Uncharacterised protein [Serratia plymuthica]